MAIEYSSVMIFLLDHVYEVLEPHFRNVFSCYKVCERTKFHIRQGRIDSELNQWKVLFTLHKLAAREEAVNFINRVGFAGNAHRLSVLTSFRRKLNDGFCYE
jgi:hypothetical protein